MSKGIKTPKNISQKTLVTRSEDIPEDIINAIISELVEQLSNDLVTVMIGAGFSKNARSLDAKTTMPSLLELGEPFYKKLHNAKSPPNKITDISVVQELAGKIEELFGRTVLDKIIEEEIPDKEFEPSILHTKLFEIPWKDIYTTNYDTLLERADPEKKYKVITKEEDLILTDKHRIIKLHGSFSSSKPYIITKKDFDSYPKKHSIFINNVENTLIATRLCLIGFSATDPNFLSWINWLKNVLIPEYIPPIYFFGVTISENERKILKNKRIQIIDLSFFNKKQNNIIVSDPTGAIIHPPTIDEYKEAYSVFFDKLSELLKIKEAILTIETTSSIPDWPEKKHFSPHPENEIVSKFKEVTENWKKNRMNYPGWVILSESRRKTLRNFTETSFIYYLEKLDDYLDIQFLFELNWRVEKYLYPLFDDWAKIYKETLDKYNPFPEILKDRKKKIIPKQNDRINWKDIRNCWIELNLALLRYYRQENKDKDWHNIAKQMEKIKHKFNPEQKSRFHYEKCLFQLFHLDIRMIRVELADWKINNKLPFWEAKRAGIIAELGDVSRALELVTISLKYIEKQIKNEKSIPECQLYSQKAYMLELYDYIHRSVNFTKGHWSWDNKEYEENYTKINKLKKYDCSPLDDLDHFNSTLKFDAPEYKRSETIYGFELNGISGIEHYGSDLYTIKTYSFINYMEEIGFPFRLPGIFWGGDAAKQSIKRLQKYSTILSMITLIRSKDEKSIDNILSRRIISMFSIDYADSLSISFLNILKKSEIEIHNGDTHRKTNLGISISSILPEILGRLTIKASFPVRKKLLKFIKAVYSSPDRLKYDKLPNLMKYLVESFSTSEQCELINDLLEFPIIPDTIINKFPDPFSFIAFDKITKMEIKNINAARVFESINIAKENNENRMKAIIRLLVLWRFNLLTESQMKDFELVLWKFTDQEGFPTALSNHFYYSAFLWFPHPQTINPEIFLKNYIINIKLPIQGTEKDKGITFTYGNIFMFGNIIGTFTKYYKYKWSKNELHILIDKITDWWNTDKNYLIVNSSNDSRTASIRDEFKARFNNLLSIFACIIQPNIDEIDNIFVSKVSHIISELNHYNIPDIMARASILKIYPNMLESIINDLCDSLCSKDENIILDAIGGTIVLLRQKCKEIEKIIRVIGHSIKYRTDIALYRFISITNTIVCDYSEYVDDALIADVSFGLHKLITETVIDKEASDEDTHSRQLCRKYAVELASSFKKYYRSKKIAIPNYVMEWERVANDPNEVVEIRNAWIW